MVPRLFCFDSRLDEKKIREYGKWQGDQDSGQAKLGL